jgi:YheC/D like ATP-grasp
MSKTNRASKWLKYKIMRDIDGLKHHVPKSKKFSKDGLWYIIEKYDDAILKPINGSRGYGVYRVTSSGDDHYKIHHEKSVRTIKGKKETYKYLSRKIRSKNYLVQRRISLATVKDHPFDIRAIVQRKNTSDSWEVTGTVAKVAGKGYIVTNITRSNGMVMKLKKAIRKSSLKKLSRKDLMSKIDEIALRTAKKLSKNKLYTDRNIFGLDMGLDQNGRVWVIETNLAPMLSHFLKLKEHKMYDRIMEYKKG